ncbi:hypothetical protein [Streptacidiphilus albus]|uniref:hypothetical protein n=1 Tax=Streptacidiphilus albus TaxID=105425 RepID=UPI00054B6F80|nr:hypothetical protein [Streptacidiphilus albus]
MSGTTPRRAHAGTAVGLGALLAASPAARAVGTPPPPPAEALPVRSAAEQAPAQLPVQPEEDPLPLRPPAAA